MNDGYWIVHDHTVSSRFFRWPAKETDWWRLVLTGHEENCNRTFGVRLPLVGMVFVCLNIPLRQKPCRKCLKEVYPPWSPLYRS